MAHDLSDVMLGTPLSKEAVEANVSVVSRDDDAASTMSSLAESSKDHVSEERNAFFEKDGLHDEAHTSSASDENHDTNREEGVVSLMGRRRATVPFLAKLVQLFEDEPHLVYFDAGRIHIPNPRKLEHALPRYFRHAKYTSFQRQLNNFGFTKVDRSAAESVYVKAKGPAVKSVNDLLSLAHVRKDHPRGPRRAPTRPRKPTFVPVAVSGVHATETHRATNPQPSVPPAVPFEVPNAFDVVDGLLNLRHAVVHTATPRRDDPRVVFQPLATYAAQI